MEQPVGTGQRAAGACDTIGGFAGKAKMIFPGVLTAVARAGPTGRGSLFEGSSLSWEKAGVVLLEP